MKIMLTTLLWLVMIGVGPHTQAQAPAPTGPLKLVYPDFNYEPFAWTDENGRGVGIFADIFQEVFERRLHVPFTFEALPWKRAQVYLANGSRDGLVTTVTPERQAYAANSSEPLIVMTIKLYTKAGSPRLEELKRVRGVADLKPFTVVDHLGNGWAEKNLKGLDVHWTTGIDAVLMQLATGRQDVFAHTSQVVTTKLKRLGLADQVVEVPGVVIESVPFYFFVSRKSAAVDLLPRFDEALRAMRADGTLQRIYDRHGLDQRVAP